MTYSYCETAMWHIIMPTAFRYLAEAEPTWNIPALKRKTKQIYRQMVSRTPDIGSMLKNPLRICLTGGMLWLSVGPLYVRAGYHVYRLDGGPALPYQDIGHGRGLL